MQKLLPLSLLLGVIALTGAGCPSQTPAEPTTNTGTENQTPVTSTNNEPASGGFTVSGSSNAKNEVTLTWNTPTNLNAKSKYRVLHSSRENPQHPEGNAFWYEVTATTKDLTIRDVSSGKRHFRVCEYLDGKCLQYSNDTVIDVQ